ncbi:unnamed protein product [marine sediment metagenome]|uniref:Uncharacterized protein n=1 Tax=marine sediment metagenome TaxID=412755 RepID=X0WS79_9ZZZZ
MKMLKKKCSRCKVYKRAREFYVDASRVDGLHTYCKNCVCERKEEYYLRVGKDRYEKQKILS